ncbi:hypothetical protein LIER_21539 [Lithospermum erythrorhizon]|uniref:Uncharacterized protein n=1 Tax=Lithospermum erythrorhizon TaxID=34254 RepID=A0AAV3QQQ9_LITER
MANSNIITLCFLALIVSNIVFCTKGRKLKAKRSLKHHHGGVQTLPATKNIGSELENSKVVVMDGNIDSFRPTNPGHSPGIGHSKHD